MMFKSYC